VISVPVQAVYAAAVESLYSIAAVTPVILPTSAPKEVCTWARPEGAFCVPFTMLRVTTALVAEAGS
jgi:hypothetical protein